jgi:hypothetical protein
MGDPRGQVAGSTLCPRWHLQTLQHSHTPVCVAQLLLSWDVADRAELGRSVVADMIIVVHCETVVYLNIIPI